MNTSVEQMRSGRRQLVSSAVLVVMLFALPVSVFADDDANIATLRRMGKAFSSIAEQASPAVVAVRATRTPRQDSSAQPFSPFDFDDPFEFFFRRRGPRQFQQPQRRQTAQGSGFIVTPDGYILTNNHLVSDAEEVRVQLSDGRTLRAEVVGTDPGTDVAVVKIDENDLPYMEMANSDALEVGEWVIAIGNPFGLSHTVTAGIVSAKGRSRLGVAEFEDFIQTDAAINFGNSGGPLLNLDGQAVGINTAIIGPGGNVGIGLAIPINMAKSVYEQLKESGTVVRGYLGVEINDIQAGVGEFYGVKDDRGAMVMKVREGSPAEEAGIKVDDIVLELRGEPIGSAADLINRITVHKPGTEVDLVVLRDGKRRTITVTLGTRPTTAELAGEPKVQEEIGVSVQTLTRELAQRLGYQNLSGVVVTEVQVGSPAEEAGIQPGDLIMEVNRESVESIERWRDVLNKGAEKRRILLRIHNERGTRVVLVTLPGK